MGQTADERLATVRVKIERAKKHIDDLQRAVAIFRSSNPYEIRTKRNPQTNQLIYYVSRVERTPVDFATILGDAIQNLRSALDHLAQQLYLVGTGASVTSWDVFFLIERSAAKYQTILPGKVKGMRQEAVDALKAIEPYKGGKGHDLWVLHTLNNIDKHRLLVTVVSRFDSVDLGAHMADIMSKQLGQAVHMPPMFVRAAGTLFPLKVGDELLILNPDAEVNKDMKFAFEIALNEPGVIERKPMLETIQHFADLVSNIVVRFKPLLT